jgi:YjbE family integral membrane protein
LRGVSYLGFESEFFSALLSIIAIDIVLGGDNAVVIALASRYLPEDKRNKAIFLGTGLAVIVRVLLTIIMVYLLNIPYLMLIGGFLLVYIAYKLLINNSEKHNIKAGTTLAQAVKTIVFADIVMGLDNVLAIAGAAHGIILLVIIGLLISVPIIIWGSKLILLFLERYPALVYIGAGILAYTAAHMILKEEVVANLIGNNSLLEATLIICIILGVIIAGWMTNQFRTRSA